MIRFAFDDLNISQIECIGLHWRPGQVIGMLGSVVDADDARQETMDPRLKSLHIDGERNEGRVWVYRISHQVCLDELAQSKREGNVQ